MQSCAPGISLNIFKVLNCLRYLEKECFLNSLMRNCYFVTLKLKFGLSEKHTKFEKNHLYGFDLSADILSKHQNPEEDFFKLCTLLKKSELY